jgi:hypothetical protein
MAGGLMQLVAYGAQDVYLTGNPQITFFKVVYRRHTNFAMETIEETMSGNIGFGRKSSVTIIRNGDLATNLYLKVTVDAVTTANLASGKFAWCKRLGHALIKSVTISIGGSQIDKQYSTWMDVWYELTHAEEQARGYAEMIGDVDVMTELTTADPTGAYTPQYTMYIPLQFWFCRNTGLALPLIALQYHEVRLDFEFNSAADLICHTGTVGPTGLTMNDASLLVNYVYLDSEERRRFAQVGHEYLIEQVQFTGEESVATSTGATTTGKYKLGFNHPTKELIWAVKGGNYTSGNQFLHYSNEWADDVSLNAAANNLATSMFTVSTTTSTSVAAPAAGNSGASTSTTVGTPVYENASVDGIHTITTATGTQTCNVTVLLSEGIVYSNTQAGFTVGTSAGSPTTAYFLKIVKNPLLAGTSGAITDVIVTVGFNATTATPRVESVTVNAHTLTVRDVSIPIGSQIDNRFAGGAVTTDVVVNYQNNYGLLIDGTGNPIASALIQLNGQDRFDTMDGNYFNYVQPYQHHTRTPADGINVYSFALHPEQHQPSGSANLSRIDNTQLNLTFADSTYYSGLAQLGFWNSATLLYVYAFSYNVLRIMSGMGGLAYSN